MVQPWGVAIDYIDPTIKPGADFFTYVNNGWLKTAQIPPDRSAAGTFLDLIIRNDERLKAIFVELHGRTNLTEEEKKLRDLYEAYMDTTADRGVRTPTGGRRSRAHQRAASLEDVARILGDPSLHIDGPFAMRIQVDDKDPDAYVVRLTQAGLGLPDRDYYLKDDPQLDTARRAYQDYLARMLAIGGRKDAPTRAAAVYALEKQIATASWPAADRRDADKTYNPLTDLEARRDGARISVGGLPRSRGDPRRSVQGRAPPQRGRAERVPEARADLRRDARRRVARLPCGPVHARLRRLSSRARSTT
jgi:putative endopeptidase